MKRYGGKKKGVLPKGMKKSKGMKDIKTVVKGKKMFKDCKY